jgi:adenine-specific DNA glycosylase
MERKKTVVNWWEIQMLCKEKNPKCSECPIEKKLECKWYQEKHYDQTIHDNIMHNHGGKFYRK